ncbi:hypothetical protein CVT24_004794 [Panaeolus cyanescens]|uniref:BD-FAE-like domain-containing protein n=1 Tax=Panaeolus cyanescens TaxID=181874 RepID=A0A409VQ48_9AGAR|nr:hypothetical protein CVT24_004794 [Panaeolus cyanescens]
MSNDHRIETFTYKKVSAPAVVFFHPGGLSVGSKESWVPKWLLEPMIAEGYMFIMPEYQLMPPANGHEILHDIQDLFIFLPTLELPVGKEYVQVDSQRIAFAGSSAGGLCSYLATSDKVPVSPKAILSLYGMGGDFFVS